MIVGAGPTGLALALFLQKTGVTPRLIDKNSGPGQASRAMAVQSRTLEFYRQLGFADEVVSRGIPIETIQIRAHDWVASEISLADFGAGLSPYPFILSFPQDDHERLLVAQLQAVGVGVEWDTEMLEMREEGEWVRATLRHKDGTEEECSSAYLCGCDGARSPTRQNLHLGFSGGTYDKTFFVADVQAVGAGAAPGRFLFCLGADDILLVLPIRSTGMHRLIGILPDALKGRTDVTFDDLRPFAEKEADLRVQNVNWFSTYKVHHRVADHFRAGWAFVLGDAGHIHSPVGGQGMNTGIGDAVNLSWKLAAVVQDRADVSLLDTYEPERIAFARSLVATTDRMFQVMTGTGLGHELFREALFPHLASFALGFSQVRTAAFRLVSQTRLHYEGSALSEGQAGAVHGGDRLPWVVLADESDNFAPLTSFDWQAHVYGTAGTALTEAARNADLALHQFDWSDGMEKAGLERDALYLVRPDGYVALVERGQDVGKLQTALAKFQSATRRASTGL